MLPEATRSRPAAKRTWRKFLRNLLLLLILAPLLLGALYLAVVLNWSYEDGDHTGYLQKFSRRGWICKTYEGELAMITRPGTAPVTWAFSVRMWDDRLPAQINALVGERVVLHYSEYRHIPSNCFGETRYFVDSVKVAD